MSRSVVQAEELAGLGFLLCVELIILHHQEVLPRHRLLGALDKHRRTSNNRQAHMLTDQVRVGSQLNEAGMSVPIAKLAHQTLLDHLLVRSLVVRDLQCALLGQGTRFSGEGHCLRGSVSLVLHCGGGPCHHRHFLQLIHDLDAVGKLIGGLERPVHLDEVFVHLVKVLVDELVDDLRRQVHPDVEDPVLALAFESLEQVALNIGHDGVSATEVVMVPLTVRLSVSEALLADATVGEQVVDKLDRQDFDLVVVLEAADADVVAFGDVEEDTVDEEQEGLDVKELAPTETQIEEELGEALIVDTTAIEFVSFGSLFRLALVAALLQARFLIIVHESLIFFVKLLTRLLSRLFFVLSALLDLLEPGCRFGRLLLLLLLALQVDLPVLLGGLVGAILVEVEDEGLLDLDVQVDVLVLAQLLVILLLHQDEPLRQDSLKLDRRHRNAC